MQLYVDTNGLIAFASKMQLLIYIANCNIAKLYVDIRNQYTLIDIFCVL